MSEPILDVFRERPDEFVSGEYISEKLQCSRTAVWKQIRKLKAQGYEFEAVPRLGYRLKQAADRIQAEMLQRDLTTRTIGRTIRMLDTVDSTQRVAREWVAAGAEEGSVVLAEGQTAGRGRMERKWHSPQGKGIWMSLILKPTVPIHFLPQLTLLTAVALCRAVKQTIPVECGIKWPNDLLIGGRKTAGILLESSAEDERLRYVIAGIGVSVNLTEEDYPPELREIATSLRIAAGHAVDRTELLQTFFKQFEDLYDLYLQQGFGPIRTLWEASSITIGRKVSVRSASGDITGLALGIDEHGALLLQLDDGNIKPVYSGDVEARA
ncbi:biotin--[acetyl-CoA-carboxylase] ligase [Paenibacillus gansuensis]|uniref:Bifunctional ligase/repressor BirA n=1 Tax=Paenibacillus gansuensis TaxID=306542 RepID=A0ABW5PCK7_9BACL